MIAADQGSMVASSVVADVAGIPAVRTQTATRSPELSAGTQSAGLAGSVLPTQDVAATRIDGA